MRFVIQRVLSADVAVKGTVIGQISKGYLVLIGISHTDTEQIADKMVRKLIGLRIFEDAAGKTKIAVVQQGIFGADMKVSLINDGPFTVILDSDEIYN